MQKIGVQALESMHTRDDDEEEERATEKKIQTLKSLSCRQLAYNSKERGKLDG